MKIIETALQGCVVIEPAVFGDERGFFYETWNSERFAERGLHYQWPRPQGKLVTVLQGEVYDVAVDIRRGSPTFGKWEAVVLSAQNKRQLWIPPGFAHGFAVLSDTALFNYLCTDVYVKESDSGVRWNDADIGVDWPISAPILSAKDEAAPFLKEVAEDRLPVYRP